VGATLKWRQTGPCLAVFSVLFRCVECCRRREEKFRLPPERKKEVKRDLTTSNNSHKLRWQLDGEVKMRRVRVAATRLSLLAATSRKSFASQMVFVQAGGISAPEIPRLTYNVFRLKIIPRSTRKQKTFWGARFALVFVSASRKKKISLAALALSSLSGSTIFANLLRARFVLSVALMLREMR
jgi:hypothetical protein